MMFEDLFQKIGFNPKEALIYSTLYQRGPNPVSTLAKLTGIKRTSVYDVVKTLLDKGLILSFQQGKTTYFTIDDVQKLYLDQKEKLRYAEKIVQELKSHPQHQQTVHVTYYKGYEGYQEMYENMLRDKPSEFVGWSNMNNFHAGVDSKFEEKWTRQRVAKNIQARLILQDSPTARTLQKESFQLKRQIKIIPAKRFPFESSCFVYENHICFFHFNTENITGIKIQHPSFYKLHKEVFEMLWGFL